MGVFQNFPYTNFHELNLDWLLEEFRKMQDEWEATKAQWASTQEFIEHYFENLDVSNEINAKINSMVRDGSLALLLQPNTTAAVNAWLASHITQPTDPALDESLTVHLAAAESAAAGRWIRGNSTLTHEKRSWTVTNADMVQNELWDYASGRHTYNNNQRFVATKNMLYFPVVAGQPYKITLTDGYYISINFYDEKFNFMGNASGTHIGWCRENVSWTAFQVRRTDNDTIAGRVFEVHIENLFTDEKIKQGVVNVMDDIDVGFYYDTTNGHGVQNSSFSRTPIYKIDDVGMLFTDVTTRITAVFWDKDKHYLGFNSVENSTTPYYARLRVIPEGAYYVGFTIHGTGVSQFNITQINSAGLQHGTTEGTMQYAVIKNAYYDQNSLSQIANYDAAILVNCDYDTLYNLADSTGGVTFIDRESNVISYHPEYVRDQHYGRRYVRPDNAYITVVLLKHAQFDGNTGAYFSLSYDTPEKGTLKGRNVYCLGDSITWLDSTNGVDPTSSLLAGYQKQLRCAGAIVDSLGVSGGSLADISGEPSIYRSLVSADPDLSGYDDIIIEGGLNDIRLSVPIGTVADTYESPNVNTANVVGAIGAIMQIIRTKNPTCNVYLCTPLPTGDANRNYRKMMNYRTAMIEAAAYWGVPVIDLTTKAQRDIATAPLALTYDKTHANNKGMEIIGKAITGEVIAESCMV